MEEIPLKAKIVWVVVIPAVGLLFTVCVIFVLDIGVWTIPSIAINAFSFDFTISSVCAFPSPKEVTVIPIPLSACALVVAIPNSLSSCLIAKTLDVKTPTVEPSVVYCIGVDPTPTKVDLGV